MVKNSPAKAGDITDTVRALSWEGPLEERMQSFPVFFPEESHAQRSLVGYSPWGHRGSDGRKQWSTHTMEMMLDKKANSSDFLEFKMGRKAVETTRIRPRSC